MNSKTEQINLTLINMWVSYKAMLPLVRNYISPSLKDLSLTHSPPKQNLKKITCKSLQPVAETPPVAPKEEISIKEEPVIEAKSETNKSLQQIDNKKSLKQIDKNIFTHLHKLVIGILLFIVIILLYFLNKSPQQNNDIIKTSSLPVVSTNQSQNSGGISNEEKEQLRRQREKIEQLRLERETERLRLKEEQEQLRLEKEKEQLRRERKKIEQLRLERERLHREREEQERLRREREVQERLRREREEQEQREKEEQEQREKNAPVELVRSYYENLNHNQANAAISKWKSLNRSRSKMRRIIRNIDWFRVNNIKLDSFSSYYATVSIDVTGKQKRGKAERWVGKVDLEKDSGNWKITKLRLSRY